ncbi:right-handed parallel beta-helix repeat-containing protein [Actinomadura barringtoniae]|uniref:Right-handed parallel beta-helix repeat-containing protein n=1 Tax=Actinomadura barringtoniae TaxID=1427535 RepID=A0A939TFH9_9ACTN|nr:right-handed parallel beta-helix repeat-containing protein [Actinomadura barringtoniae]MBO2454390.1 right-handed parallel beta-helix repeat-containing protein [Actinomadura barringtoniae]
MRTVRGVTRAAALTLAAGAVALPVTSAQATTVTCGQVVTADLRLTADLTCSGTALSIGASGVTVDLNGHTITGDGSGRGIAIEGVRPNPSLSNTTVRNGTISDFESAIGMVDTQDVRLSRLNLKATGSNTALRVDIGTKGARVDHSVLRASTGGYAVRGLGGTDLTITGSRVLGGWINLVNSLSSSTISHTDLDRAAIVAQQSNNVLLDHDTLVRTPVTAFFSFGVTIRNSKISGAERAVDFGTDRDVLITGNVFAHNLVGVHSGPPGLDTERATISKNLFVGNGAAGVWLESLYSGGPAGNFAVVGNRFQGNGHRANGLTDAYGNTVNDGLHIDTKDPSGVEVTRNRTDHNADFGIEIRPGSAIDGGGNTSAHDPNGCLGVVCS